MEHWGETPRLATYLSCGCLWASVIQRRGATYPSEQMVLQIEYASIWAQLLDCPNNLNLVLGVLNYRSQIPNSYLDCLSNNLSNNQSQPLLV